MFSKNGLSILNGLSQCSVERRNFSCIFTHFSTNNYVHILQLDCLFITVGYFLHRLCFWATVTSADVLMKDLLLILYLWTDYSCFCALFYTCLYWLHPILMSFLQFLIFNSNCVCQYIQCPFQLFVTWRFNKYAFHTYYYILLSKLLMKVLNEPDTE